jgi:hypothetical protein
MFTKLLPSNGSLFQLSGIGWGGGTQKQQVDLKTLLFTFENKECRLKKLI